MIRRFACELAIKARMAGEAKNVVFIVYNFFEKCLNQSLAAAFRAPKRCGLLSTDFGRREV